MPLLIKGQQRKTLNLADNFSCRFSLHRSCRYFLEKCLKNSSPGRETFQKSQGCAPTPRRHWSNVSQLCGSMSAPSSLLMVPFPFIWRFLNCIVWEKKKETLNLIHILIAPLPHCFSCILGTFGFLIKKMNVRQKQIEDSIFYFVRRSRLENECMAFL